MAPYKICKTYKRKSSNNTLQRNCKVNSLVKSKIKLKPLPAKTNSLFKDDSFKVEFENTFDKLLKTKNFNHVSYKHILSRLGFSSSEENEESNIVKSIQSTVCTPIKLKLRNNKKNQRIIKEASSSEESNLTINELKKTNTLDKPVNSSLSIEIVRNCASNDLSFSFIKLSNIVKNNSVSDFIQKTYEKSSELSSLLQTFNESQIYSSTPVVNPHRNKDNIISPIEDNNHFSVKIHSTPVQKTPIIPITPNSNSSCRKGNYITLRKRVVYWSKNKKKSLNNSNNDAIEATSKKAILELKNSNIKPVKLLEIYNTSLNNYSDDLFSDEENPLVYPKLEKIDKDNTINENSQIFNDPPQLEPSINIINSTVHTTINSITECKNLSNSNNSIIEENLKTKFLKPGKLYRRSVSLIRRTQFVFNVPNVRQISIQSFSSNKSDLKNDLSSLRDIIDKGYVSEKQKNSVIPDANLECGYKEISLNRRNTTLLNFDQFAAKDIVFRRCGQKEPLPFNQCYPDSLLKNCQKIGEGVFGEVFLFRNQENTTTVMKIIPIEGDQIVNGEKQKKYEEILSEIEIAMELSNLRNNNVNRTSAFIEILNVKCVQGRYPDKLLDLWELYDEVKHSQNDSPEMFNNQQLYIILELSNGGRDLESYVFNNASQAYSVFRQTALALACAENQLKFEHRDLHWGNLLITPTDQKKINYSINGKDIEVTTLGVIISIIDFTLSRIQCDDVVIFNDLSQDDELFLSKGDYQFDIYRLMQQHNGNEWQHFEPYTNILWLHYILEKTLSSLRYKNIKTKIHKEYLTKIKKLHEEILTYNSTLDFINSKFL